MNSLETSRKVKSDLTWVLLSGIQAPRFFPTAPQFLRRSETLLYFFGNIPCAHFQQEYEVLHQYAAIHGL